MAVEPVASAGAPAGVAELVQRLDEVSDRLAAINDYMRKPAPDLAGIAVALPSKAQEAESVLGKAVEAAAASDADLLEVSATLQKMRSLDRIFDKWRQRLREEVALLDPWREQLRADAGFLRAATQPADEPAADDGGAEILTGPMRARLEDLANSLDATRKPLLNRLDVVVAADVEVGELQGMLRDLQAKLDSARLSRQENPLAITAPPIWKIPGDLGNPARVARQNFDTLVAGVEDYVDARPQQVTAFVLILAVLLFAVWRLRRSILAKAGGTDADELLTNYPITVTLLVWTLIGPIILLPELPLGLTLVQALLAVALLWRILPVLVTAGESRPVKALLLLSAAFQLPVIVLGDYWYARLATVLLGLLAMLVFRDLARRSRVEPGGRALFRRAIHGAAVAAPYVISVGLIAEIVGVRSLGTQAIGGMVFVTLSLCTLLAADFILRTMLDAWVSGPGGRWFRSVRHWPESVRLWGRRVIRLVLVLSFLNVLPVILPLLEPVWNAVMAALGAPVTVGNLDVSLGNLIWFSIAVGVALLVARFVRFVLDEDVFSRMPMPMGAASAASRLIYYGLVVAGILFDLAASGVELSRLTLVISALSVGIGFGLQNIVNNFVSGLILAFERPVREGDLVTLGQTTGRVAVIGLRATRIRTAEGAEVVVPNGNLISAEVTNWTLSDRARRIEIAVGVEYDADPDRVQELLLEAVKDVEGVAAHPAPTTVFRAFGASSLDFAVLFWTSDTNNRTAVENLARTRILAALRDARISIPYPRMDVQVQDAAATLAPPDAER